MNLGCEDSGAILPSHLFERAARQNTDFQISTKSMKKYNYFPTEARTCEDICGPGGKFLDWGCQTSFMLWSLILQCQKVVVPVQVCLHTPCYVVVLLRVLLVDKQSHGTSAALERTEMTDYTGNDDHRTEPWMTL